MNNDLISRSALLEQMHNHYEVRNPKQNATMDECCMMVIHAPAIEAEPVRHGRWVDNHCTECGEMPMGTEAWESLGIEPPRFERFMDYCPCCGAKMDGGAEK